jgi:hypothetical protein
MPSLFRAGKFFSEKLDIRNEAGTINIRERKRPAVEFWISSFIIPDHSVAFRPLLCSGPAAPRKWTAGFFY